MVSMPRQLVMLVASAIALALSVIAAPSAGWASNAARACPVTVPGPDDPAAAPFSAASFNYGNAFVRVQLNWRETLTAGTLPGGGSVATLNPDGSVYAKVGWWRGVPGQLVVRGRRLDARAPPFRGDVGTVASYGASGFVASGLTFPSVGCWQVVGKVGRASLTFVVKITTVRRRA
jgi:hypothetical protein